MTHPGVAAELPSTMQVLERGWLSSNNVLLFDGDGTATLVDTGYVTQAPMTVALVEHALQGRTLARIVNTHLHSDHCGGNAALRARFGASIAIPPGHAAAVRSWDETELTYRATGQQCARFDFDAVLQPGERLRMGELDWKVVGAPGHDVHQVMLWCASERALIAADALWQHGFGAIFPEIEGESGFSEQAALLDQIEDLSPQLVIPGHGAPFADVGAALQRARQRLAALRTDPARNARHVAKALIKFWIMDVREVRHDDALAHFGTAAYFEVIRSRYFADLSFAGMIDRFIDELVASGALTRRGAMLVDQETTP